MCKFWEYTTNHAISEQGRIWVVWDPSILNFEVAHTTKQAVHGKAVLGNGSFVHLSFIYGLCDYRSRRDLWNDLIFISQSIAHASWLILGDFNVSRYPQDQLHGLPSFSKAMSEFNECLNAIEVDDIRSVGRHFTWSNKRVGNAAVNKKLDRVLGNWGWHKVFNHSCALFHNPGVSDHSPVSVTLADPWRCGNKPFKFLNFWAGDGRFPGLVKSVWGKRIVGNPLEVVISKLRMLKRELKFTFNKHDPNPKKEAIRAEIEVIQSKLLSNPSDVGLLQQEKHLISTLGKVKDEEESFLKHKSRITWLKLGDSNTKFFHRSVTSLHHRNYIDRLQKPDGSWTCSQTEVEQLAVDHFRGFLGVQAPHTVSNPGYSKSFRRHKKFCWAGE
ncbi:Exo_endo_phos domain-containing protein [Cephalotus follicularis]|uniref:Exo_endo_phos domain-containing protein n=1 Tax=Cephalotus follicularis TaxID=3775 RepID=A0A1Q3D800_CEPFO|nr:Exo_endo_phos domain-containing protein [Cephalotus follicularis]